MKETYKLIRIKLGYYLNKIFERWLFHPLDNNVF